MFKNFLARKRTRDTRYRPALEFLEDRSVPSTTHFAVIGDYGTASPAERDVSRLVQSWNPDYVVTVGDNNYPDGAADVIDAHIGQFYHQYISPYTGSYGAGASTNRFFPSLGNHDWVTTGAQPYLNYFTLPGNERYYTFTRGPVQFFAIDSDLHEPDGTSSTSVQGRWLESELAASTAPFKLVYFHHPAYSSGSHGSMTRMQWPFQMWGASAVLTGHDHDYERLNVDGLTYFVDGLGGASTYSFGTPVAGSQVRYTGDYGAMKVDADDSQMTFQFINRSGTVIDTYTIHSTAQPSMSFQNGVYPTTAYSGTRDTQIVAQSSTTNYGSADSLLSDGSPDNGVLLKWDVSAIPAGSTVTSVKMSFNVTNQTTDTYEIYKLLRNWGESQATWKAAFTSGSNWQIAGAQGASDRGSTVLGTLTAPDQGLQTITLNSAGVAVVQSWVNNPSTNFGFTIQDYANAANAVGFSSSEAATSGLRPRLSIAYDPPAAASPATARTSASAAPMAVAGPTSLQAYPLATMAEASYVTLSANAAPGAQPAPTPTNMVLSQPPTPAAVRGENGSTTHWIFANTKRGIPWEAEDWDAIHGDPPGTRTD